MRFYFSILFIIFISQFCCALASFLAKRSLNNDQIAILEETIYNDCYDNTSNEITHNKWSLYDQDQQSTIFIPECIKQCGSFGNILGPFGSKVGLKRQIQINAAHTDVIIKAEFIQIDGWSLGQQMVLKINDQIVYNWEYNGADNGDVNQCDISLIDMQDHKEQIDIKVPHTNNMLDVYLYSINSNSELVNMWALKSFSVLAIKCDPSINTLCQSIEPVKFSLKTFSKSKPKEKPSIQIQFDNPIDTELTSSDINIEIEGVDKSLYNFTLAQIGQELKVFQIYFEQMNFSTHYGQQIQINILKQVRDSQGMALTTYSQDTLMPNYYNYSNEQIKTMSQVKNIIKGASYFIILLTAILTFIFDKFNWLFYSTDIGQILYLSTFINVKLPQNVKQVLLEGCSIFHLQGLPGIFDPIISQSTSESQIPFFQHFEELGISSLFLSNAGNLSALALIFLFTFILLQIISQTKIIKYNKIQTFLEEILEKRFKWRLFISIGYFLYAQVWFASLIQIFTWKFDSASSCISYILTIICIGFGFLFPIGMYMLVVKNREKVLEDSVDSNFTSKFGIAWQDLKKPEKDGFYRTILFYFFLLLRRSLYACIVVFFQFNANLQIALLNICNVTIIFIVMFQMPIVKNRNNYKIIISESILIIEYMVMQSYQNEQEDEDSRLNRGWVIVFASAVIIFIQILFLLIDIFQPFVQYVQEKYKLIQMEKQRRKSIVSNNQLIKQNITSKVIESKILSQGTYNDASFAINKDNSIPKIPLVNNGFNKDSSLSQISCSPSSRRYGQLNFSRGLKNKLSIDINNKDLQNITSNQNIIDEKNQQSFNQISSNYINQIEDIDDYNNQGHTQRVIAQTSLTLIKESTPVNCKTPQKNIMKQNSYLSIQSNSFQQYEFSYYLSQNQIQDQMSTNVSQFKTFNENNSNPNICVFPKASIEDISFSKSLSPGKNSQILSGNSQKNISDKQVFRNSARNITVNTQQQSHFTFPVFNKSKTSEEEDRDQTYENKNPRIYQNFVAKSNQTIQEQPGEENGSVMGLSQHIHSKLSMQDSPLEIPSATSSGQGRVFQILKTYTSPLKKSQQKMRRIFTNIEEENEESNQNTNSIIQNENQSEKEAEKLSEKLTKSTSLEKPSQKVEGIPQNIKENENLQADNLRIQERKKSLFSKLNTLKNPDSKQN